MSPAASAMPAASARAPAPGTPPSARGHHPGRAGAATPPPVTSRPCRPPPRRPRTSGAAATRAWSARPPPAATDQAVGSRRLDARREATANRCVPGGKLGRAVGLPRGILQCRLGHQPRGPAARGRHVAEVTSFPVDKVARGRERERAMPSAAGCSARAPRAGRAARKGARRHARARRGARAGAGGRRRGGQETAPPIALRGGCDLRDGGPADRSSSWNVQSNEARQGVLRVVADAMTDPADAGAARGKGTPRQRYGAVDLFAKGERPSPRRTRRRRGDLHRPLRKHRVFGVRRGVRGFRGAQPASSAVTDLDVTTADDTWPSFAAGSRKPPRSRTGVQAGGGAGRARAVPRAVLTARHAPDLPPQNRAAPARGRRAKSDGSRGRTRHRMPVRCRRPVTVATGPKAEADAVRRVRARAGR